MYAFTLDELGLRTRANLRPRPAKLEEAEGRSTPQNASLPNHLLPDDFLDATIVVPGSRLASSRYPLKLLPLPVRVRNRLGRLNVETVGDLASLSNRQFLAVRNLGQGSLQALQEVLANSSIPDDPPASATTDLDHDQMPAEVDITTLASMIDAWIGIGYPREIDIHRRRWRLDDTEPRTLQDLAEEYGVSRERIRQLEAKSIRRLHGAIGRSPHRRQIEGAIKEAVLQQDGEDVDSSAPWRQVASTMWPGCDQTRVGGFLFAVASGHPEPAAAWSRYGEVYSRAFEARARQARLDYVVESKRLSRERRLGKLLEGTWWPEVTRTDLGRPDVSPLRGVGEEDELRITWLSPKLGRSVHCDSGLEAAFFELCDASRSVSWYCEQPVSLPYEIEGAARHYVPDALLQLSDGRLVLVEVKPVGAMAEAVNLAKWDAALRWCDRRGVGFLVCSDRQSASTVFAREVGEEYERRVLGALEMNPSLRWPEFKGILDATNASTLDLVALAHRHSLHVRRAPWRLERRPDAGDRYR